jgi:PAS domain S-box-containing protein
MSSLPFTSIEEFAENHHHLFEVSPFAFHEIDTNGVIRSVNEAECELLGYAPHELIDHYAWEFVAPEHREAVRNGIARKIAREQPIRVFSREFRRVDGSYLWVEIHESLIEDAAGKVIGIRSGLFDITERYRFEMEIQKQYDRMRCLLRSWTRAIITTDPLGHVDFMNPAAEELTGWHQEDSLGHHVEVICPVFDNSGEPVDLMSCILEGPATCKPSGNSQIVDRSGASFGVSWCTSPIRNDNDVIIGAALVLEKV